MPVLTVSSVTVYSDRLEALVHVEGAMRTSAYAGLCESVTTLFPTIVAHECDNDERRRMSEELADTELAHLVEHVALDLMRRAGVGGRLRGDTSWDFERDGAGVFHVSLDCPDDALCVGALSAAAQIVDDLARGVTPAAVDATVARLRLTRGHDEPRPRPKRSPAT